MTHTLDDDTLLEEEWLAAPRSRSRSRTILVVLLAASLLFLGGVQTQKRLGSDSSGSPAAAAGLGGLPGGGTFPGGGQGFPAGGGQAPGGTATGSAGGEADDSEAVIGTVVSIDGDIWTVKDLGGTEHKVRVTGDAAVRRETKLSTDQVAAGDQVDISGTSTDGQLTADEITLR